VHRDAGRRAVTIRVRHVNKGALRSAPDISSVLQVRMQEQECRTSVSYPGVPA
jgi:hypothetical protein